MRKLIFKRPLCFLCFITIAVIYIVVEFQGGVDLNSYIKDNKKIFASGYIYAKSHKNGNEILYIGDCSFCDYNDINMDTIYSDLNMDDTENNYYEKNINNWIENYVSNRKNKMLVYINNDKQDIGRYKIGQKVIVAGQYSNFDLPENEGQFNMRKYYRIRGIEGSLKKSEIIAASDFCNAYRNALYEVKERTKSIYEFCLDEEKAGIMEALVLGDKDMLNSDVKEQYQETGISHILSLSGLHIASVGMCIFGFFKKSGIGIRRSSVLSFIIMASYSVMTGLSTSTVRALIMFSLGLIAKSAGRTYDLITAVSLSAFLIVIENPLYVYDSGFLLSVSAVIGIAVLFPAISSLSSFKVWRGISVSLAATMSTLPVVMASFYKVSRFGIILNLIIVPFVGLLLFSGIAAGITGDIIMSTKTKMILPKILLLPAKGILSYYSIVTENISGIHMNRWVTGCPKNAQTIVYIMLILAATWIYIINKNKSIVYKALYITTLILAVCTISYRSKDGLEIRTVSVGQGACNIISGREIPTIMIDCGSSDEKNIAKYRIKPLLYYNGTDVIDYLFITHPDSDHISGIKEIFLDNMASIRVKHVFMAIRDDELCKLAQSAGASFHTMKANDKIRNNSILIECISPYIEGNESWDDVDANDASLVLKITFLDSGYKALFTGDISEASENKIVEYCAENNIDMNVDFMSVPHHGSRFSSSEDFLKLVSPDVCTISAGKNNSYGHPHKETLNRLAEVNSLIFRTDELGEIIVKNNGSETVIKGFVKQ